jgi:DNA repair photolyase
MINRHYKEVKTALRRSNLANAFNLGKYGLSPYSACQHGCMYCDGRAEKYFVEGVFDKDITIRTNLPELLAKEIHTLKEPGFISIGSGISDAYQPVEESEQLMKRCAEEIALSDYPVTLLTKSALVMHHMDIWKEVHRKNGFLLMVSLTFLDDNLRQTFEPGASSVDERLEMIECFKKAGMYVGVLAMPFIPFISDTDENIRRLFERLKSLNVDFVMPGGLTLRPGRQKDIFIELIKQSYPEHLTGIEAIYKENRQSGNSIYSYREKFNRVTQKALSTLEMPAGVPHYVYKDRMPLYDEVYVLLRHMQYLYSVKAINTKQLDRSVEKYREWIEAEKAEFNHKRKLSFKTVEDKLFRVIDSGEISEIIENEKLSLFLKDVAIERKTFNYSKLKLE